MAVNSDQKVTISLETASIFKTILIIILFIVLFMLSDIVLVVLTAILIASAIEPATRWFVVHRVPRLPAVLIIYFGGAFVLAFTFYFLFVPLLGDTVNFLKILPENLIDLEVWNPLREGFFNQTVFRDLTKSFSIQEIINQANQALSGTFNFLGAITSFFGGMLSLILIIVLSFYLAVQEGGVIKFLKFVTPLRHEDYIVNLWKRAEIKIGLWVQGQIVLAIVVGVLTYLGLVLLGVPNALLLAFLSALLEIIPVFGPILASVPAITLGFVEGGLTMALIVAGLYLIIQQFESQLIYPLVIKKIVGLSPILVILSLIAGFRLAGFLGMFLFVPMVTVLMVFLEDFQKRKYSSPKIKPEV